MKLYSDLHIHSRFSRATSVDIDVNNLVKHARMKGLGLLGTGDFTHPSWLSELKGELKDDGSGILKTADGFPFILSSEISSIYSQAREVKRVHNVVLSPGFQAAEEVNKALTKRGAKLASDGRPITGIPCPELVELIMSVDDRCEVIPAHIWTPWFSLFGSKSGFDSVKECFQDQVKHIHALETGLSSNPLMNWRLSQLDGFSLVSFSDSHSFWPWRIGRESTVLDLNELSYENVVRALRTGNGLEGTIEVDPSYGKYHYDGHRDCNVVFSPEESRKHKGICPVCKRPLTIGVLNRVEGLADRKEGFRPENARGFVSLLPLSEIIGFALNVQPFSKKVWEVYSRLIRDFGSEYSVLMDTDSEGLEKTAGEKAAGMIMQVREGRMEISPGYDGVYGILKGMETGKKIIQEKKPQRTLADF